MFVGFLLFVITVSSKGKTSVWETLHKTNKYTVISRRNNKFKNQKCGSGTIHGRRGGGGLSMGGRGDYAQRILQDV